MVKCWHCKQESSAAHYARIVENRTALYGPWDGWRMSGPYLIAPGKAGKIMPARLLGILWAENARRSTEKNGTIAARSCAIVPFVKRSPIGE